MPGIIDCLAAAEAAAMLADDCALLADHDAIGMAWISTGRPTACEATE